MATAQVFVDGTGWRSFSAGDLPNSGVTAGTYGDSTHVGQFTVAATGTITAASNVAITGGGGSSGLVSLFDSTLGADSATIDTGAGGIAAGHVALLVCIIARTADAGANASLRVRLNNDSGANYDDSAVYNVNATPNGRTDLAQTGWSTTTHGDGGSAGYPGVWRLDIPGYDQTTFWKVATMLAMTMDATAGNNVDIAMGLGWRSTAAISRMAVTAASGANLKAGSRLLVYGTQ